MTTTNMIMHFLCIAALLLLICMVVNNEGMSARKKSSYLLAIVLSIISTIAEICSINAQISGANYRTINIISNTLSFAVLPLIPLLLTASFGKKRMRHGGRRFAPAIINMLIAFLSPATGWFFSISETNEYTRGPLYFIFFLTCAWGIFVLFSGILSSLKHYHRNLKFTMVYMLAFITSGVVLQIAVPASGAMWICQSISLYMYYAFMCELNFMFDTLTNMYNRHVYESDLRRKESQPCATIVLFDIDDFKTINDTYGHLYGDHCIETLAGFIWDVFSPYGNCYRIGGDEFCVVSCEMDDHIFRELFIKLNQRIQVSIARDRHFPTVSYGCAHYVRGEGSSLKETIHMADALMYENKRSRKRDEKTLLTESAANI